MNKVWDAGRIALAVAGGNLAGAAAFRVALLLTQSLWRGSLIPVGGEPGFGTRLFFTALTAVLFAAPPVLIGAIAARLAAQARPVVGLAAGLWSFGFAWWWPAMPLLGPQAWVGPTVLVLLSGLIGGWLIDQRASVKRAQPFH